MNEMNTPSPIGRKHERILWIIRIAAGAATFLHYAPTAAHTVATIIQAILHSL